MESDVFIYKALGAVDTDGLRTGGVDAYGMVAERAVSDGCGNPCRACLCDVPAGEGMLIAAFRPFDGLHPYAETGPIFLCAACENAEDSTAMPTAISGRGCVLIKGYSVDDRFVENTGVIVPPDGVEVALEGIFDKAQVDYAHIRSGMNNCYLCRVERG